MSCNTQLKTTVDFSDLMQNRVPSAVPDIKLESVVVTKTDESYTIEFTPIDCGHDFPLLGEVLVPL